MQNEPVPLPAEEVKKSSGIWGAWPTVGLSAAILGIFFVAQTLVTVIFVAVLMARNPSLGSLDQLRDFFLSLQSNGLLLSIAIIVSGVCGYFFIWLFIKIRRGRSFEDYLELKMPDWRWWPALIPIVAIVICISIGIEKYYPDSSSLKIMVDAYQSCGWIPIFWIATVVVAPVFEETFMRGFLFVGLRDSKVGPFWTVIITAVIFSILHAAQYNVGGLLEILVLGLVFGAVRLFSKSLWPTIILHAAWNVMAMVTLVYYLNGAV